MCIQQLEIIHSMLPDRSFTLTQNLMHFCSDLSKNKWNHLLGRTPQEGFVI